MDFITNPPINNHISSLVKRSCPPIIKQFHNPPVSTDTELNKHIKMNPKSLSKVNIKRLLFSSFGSLNQPNAQKTPRDLIRIRKITNMLQHKKIIPNLAFVFRPANSFEMGFIISKLKALHHSASLDLDLSTVPFCTPQHLESLSLALGHFKKLNSLSITFPTEIKNSHCFLSALFLALSRLNSLSCLSLNFTHVQISHSTMTLTLEKCLSKVPQLKSLALTMIDCGRIGDLALSCLPACLKKLPSLQSLYVDLLDSGSVRAKTLQPFFQSLHDLKPFKNLTLYVEDPKDSMNFLSLRKGSATLKSSQEKSWRIKYDAVQYDDSLEHLADALQISPCVQHLSLDFTQSYSLTDQTLSEICSSIQYLPSLYSLQFNLDKAKKISAPIQMIEPALRSLVTLRSLDLNFNGLEAIDDLQLTSLAAGLQELVELKTLKLDLSYLGKLTNQGIESLSNALGKLVKLEDFSLALAGNLNFNKSGMDSLAKALQKLVSLSSIALRVKECHNLKGEENFSEINKALDQLKSLKSSLIEIPKSLDSDDDENFGKEQIIWD